MTHIHHGNVHDFSGRGVRVFLDGYEMDARKVFEANEEGGYLKVGITDKEGQVFVDPRWDAIRTATLRGRVNLTFDGADLSQQHKQDCDSLWRKQLLKAG